MTMNFMARKQNILQEIQGGPRYLFGEEEMTLYLAEVGKMSSTAVKG